MDLNELLQAWRHALPSAIVRPLEAGKGGMEYVKAAAEAFRAIGSAVVEGGIRKTYFLAAPRADRSSGTFVLTFTGGGSYLLRNARFQTDDGRTYVGPPEVPVTSGAELDVEGEFASPDYDFADEGVSLEYVSGLWLDPGTGAEVDAPADLAVALGANAPTGGQAGILELLCQGRDVHARDGEDAETLRARAWEPVKVVVRERIEQLLNDTLWANQPAGVAPPYRNVQLYDPREIGFAWGDGAADGWEGAAWGDGENATWCPRPPWFAVFVPPIPEQDAPDAWSDDSAWGDPDFAWGDVDLAQQQFYAALAQAARDAAAKGVGVLVYIGEPLTGIGPPYVAAQGGAAHEVQPEVGPPGMTPAARYAYGVVAPSSYGWGDIPTADALVAFVWQDANGQDYVFLVLDQPIPPIDEQGISTATGGSAALTITLNSPLEGPSTPVPVAVQDDPSDSYDPETGAFSWSWPPGTSDGIVIGPLTGFWRVSVTPGVVSNISAVKVLSANGAVVDFEVNGFLLQRGPWDVGQG